MPPISVARNDDVPARILIAGDHPILRDGLKRLLESEPGLQVVGDAGDGASTLQLVRQLRPDLLLFDVAMPNPGMDILRALAATSILPRTIVLTGSIGPKQLVAALKLGVRGIVLKESTTSSLCESIRRVLADHCALGPEQVDDLVCAMVGSPGEGLVRRNRFHLTPRQLQIVAAVAFGESNREVAEHFSISEETVKRHLSNIFDKLGVFSRLELAIFALNLLPVRFAAVVLILASFALFALEAKFAAHGVLAIGGMVTMVLGGLLLVDAPIPEMRVNLLTALAVTIPLGGITVFLMTIALKARANKVVTGAQGLVGEIGIAQTALSPRGKIFVHGEIWDAMSASGVPAGQSVVVLGVDGLQLRVEPSPASQRAPAANTI